MTEAESYDNADRLSSIADTEGSSPLASFTYGRDNHGLVTSETDTGTPGAGTTGDSYNALDQLTTAGSSSYSYNSANDLTTAPSGATQAFNADDETCWSGSGTGSCSSAPTGATTFSYSSEGNRTSATDASGTTSYGYDQANDLTSVTPASGSATSYVYDGNGLLEGETTGSSTTEYTWSPVGNSVPLLLEDGTNYYLYGNGTTPIEQINASSGASSYLLADELGSTRAITDSSGTVTATFSFDAWGNETGSTGTATTPFLYAGSYYDAAAGLDYLRARWYDPGTGQFMSLDPQVASTLAPYSYADDDPLNGTDPSGEYISCGGGRTGSACDAPNKTTTTKTPTKKPSSTSSSAKSSSSTCLPRSRRQIRAPPHRRQRRRSTPSRARRLRRRQHFTSRYRSAR